MPFGVFSWTTNSWRRMSTASLLSAKMVCFAVSFPASLHIRRIIRRSKLRSLARVRNPDLRFLYRVLLATIRNLGKAPCPRCYLAKADIPKLGTVHDMKKRETLARTDAHVHDGTLTRIRNWIYKLGRNVKSTTFDFFLLARSWTPTSVILERRSYPLSSQTVYRTPSPINFRNSGSIRFECSFQTLCTSSSSEYSRRFSFTSFVFSLHTAITLSRTSISGESFAHRHLPLH